MNADTETPAALSDVRVLDLTGTGGQYATKMLADLGADVVRIEPPAGASGRRIPPFAEGQAGFDRSLAFWYWNTSKRSVTLDLTTEDGRALFRRMLPRYDVLVHTFTPSEATGIGLAPDELRAAHPGLIECSITPYGEWGPHADWLGTDLTVASMAGMVTLAGFPDRPPSAPPGEQAAVCGSIHAAQGILLALLARDRDGQGRRVEVSAQEAMGMTEETAMQYWDLRREVRTRQGENKLLPGIGTYECADGHIYSMIGVPGFGAPIAVLIAWMAESDMAGDLDDPKWTDFLGQINMRQLTALRDNPAQMAEVMPKFAHIDQYVQAFYKSKTKTELYTGGQGRRLMIGAVNSAKDLRDSEQLGARAWWQEVEHQELGETFAYPGPPYRHSATPWRISRRPPMLGEHTLDVLQDELGLTREQCEILMGAGVI